MELSQEQIRLLLHFQFKLGFKATEAAKQICDVYGDVCKPRKAQEWFKTFREEGDRLTDKPRSGRPREVDRHAVLDAIEENPSMTTRMLAEDFECSKTTIEEILREAGKVWKKSKWIPHELTQAQKQKRIDVATALLNRNNETPFLESIVTGDEKWIPFKNPDHHNQWLSPGQAPSSTPTKDFRQEKRLLCVFWDRRHVIHWELLEKGQTVTAVLYCEQLERLRRKMRNRQGPIILLHDNARPHTANLTKKNWSILNGSIWIIRRTVLTWHHRIFIFFGKFYSESSDLSFFRSLEHYLRGKIFQNVDEMRLSLTQFFDSKPRDFYRRGIYLLPDKWQDVIDVEGEYFE